MRPNGLIPRQTGEFCGERKQDQVQAGSCRCKMGGSGKGYSDDGWQEPSKAKDSELESSRRERVEIPSPCLCVLKHGPSLHADGQPTRRDGSSAALRRTRRAEGPLALFAVPVYLQEARRHCYG